MSDPEPDVENRPLDPNSDPEPKQGLTEADIGKGMLAVVAAVVPAVGVGLLLAAGSMGTTRGSTRTYHLEWQRRQAEVQQAVAQADADRAATAQDVTHE